MAIPISPSHQKFAPTNDSHLSAIDTNIPVISFILILYLLYTEMGKQNTYKYRDGQTKII
ncbi:hypothetical protein CsSME_00024630 [Camellia sinensis var. sinensis]